MHTHKHRHRVVMTELTHANTSSCRSGVMCLNSYGYILLEENQHIRTGSNKIEGAAPELNFGILQLSLFNL